MVETYVNRAYSPSDPIDSPPHVTGVETVCWGRTEKLDHLSFFNHVYDPRNGHGRSKPSVFEEKVKAPRAQSIGWGFIVNSRGLKEG